MSSVQVTYAIASAERNSSMLQSSDTQPAAANRAPLPAEAPILREGDTCWRIARARRFAVIVDAADYFARLKEALLEARHSVLLIGWDFDLRIRLTPDDPDDGEVRLGEFLKHLVRQRPDLRIYILKWDMAVLFTLRWEALPMMFSDLVVTRRIHLRFDSKHPPTAAHHQKIAVIDDAIAFCGGIDMTDHRWDTRAHDSHDAHRIDPEGETYGPWHDSTTAVDGEAARALGDLARERWRCATGQRLRRPDADFDAWPNELVPQLHDVAVGVARTMPAYEGRPAAHEVERLYIAAIHSARRTIYIESQFFASAAIAEALAKRLKEPDGPEVIVVNPRHSASWLEQETMDSARALIVKRVRDADHHDRFRIYYPVNESGEAIYVHSKVLAVDDRLLRVGSSNINNRSMGFDSECDLAVEANPREPDIAPAVVGIRNGLLAEHLGVPVEAVARAVDDHGSMMAAIESLRRPQGRTLELLPVRQLCDLESALAESRIADPERPVKPESLLKHGVKRIFLRQPLAASAALGLAALGGYWAVRSAAKRSRRAAS
ncbi:MAG TPA: phospholipase D-like domain-containing protein [Pseudolabrys sp.]|nr:phospholipase D-like domain-containing protein [Pseudolabrys sp.]